MASAWFRRSNQKSAAAASTATSPVSPIAPQQVHHHLSPEYSSSSSHSRREEQRYTPKSQHKHLSPTASSSSHPPPSSYSNSAHARPKSSQARSGNASSLNLGNLFGLSKPKRPTTSQGESSPRDGAFRGDSHPRITVVDRIPSPANAGSTFSINEISPYSSSRARAQTVSSTSTRPPLTPGDSADLADRPMFRRDRSDSSASDFNSNPMARKAQQMPSLLQMEPYDPFATHSDSVYVVSGTPPVQQPPKEPIGPMSPFQRQQSQVPLDPAFRNTRASDNGYIEGSITGRPPTSPSAPLSASFHMMPRRPSAPPSFNPSPNNVIVSPISPLNGPASAGPTTKKHLPFRANPKEKSRSDAVDPSTGYLLPRNSATSASRIYRLSGTSTNSGGSNSASSSATHLPLPPGRTTAEHLAVISNKLDPASLKAQVPPPIPSLHLNTTELRSEARLGSHSVSTSPVAPSPSSTSDINVHTLRTHLAHESKASMDGRNKRLRAALAVSVQELPEGLSTRKSSYSSVASSNSQSHNRPPELDLSSQALPALHFDGPSPISGRSPAITPKEIESGTYELLVPTKPPFSSNQAHHGGTPTSVYGAPSFIAEPLMSPGDHFFASPYPSGVHTVPIPFHLFNRKSEDSAAGVRPCISEESHSQDSHVLMMGKSLEDRDFVARLGHSPILEQFPSPPTTSPPSSRKSSASGDMLDAKASSLPPFVMQDSSKELTPIKIPHSTPVNVKSPLSSNVTSPVTLNSPESPLSSVPMQPFSTRTTNKGMGGIGQNPDASMSTLSFSSSVSGAMVGSSGPVFPEDEDDESSDFEIVGKKSRSGSRNRRGSEGTSGASGSTGFLPIGTSFGAKSAMKAFRPSTPPPMPTKSTPPTPTPTHTPSSKSSMFHQAAVGVGLRRPRTGSNSNSSGLMGMNIGTSPVFSNLMSTLNLAGVTTAAGSGDEKAPRKQKSFSHALSPPLPPVPPLRHCNSFNPPSSTTTTITNAVMDTVGLSRRPSIPNADADGNVSSGPKKKMLTRRSSRTSVTKNLGLGFGDRSVSSSTISEGKTKKSQSGHQNTQSIATTIVGEGGSKGESETDYEWVKEKSKFSKSMTLDDDTRSLMTLNAVPGPGGLRGSIDDISGSSWWDDGRPFSPDNLMHSPAVMTRSVTTPFVKSSAIISGLRQKSVSPTRNDFRPMHIMDPSELMKVGTEAENEVLRTVPDLVEEDLLMRQDFEDFVGSTNGVLGEDIDGGQTWLSELGALDGGLAVGVNARLIHHGTPRRGAGSANRSFSHRPTTANGRSDSIKSHASSLPRQRKRPSTSQGSMSSIPTLSSVLSAGPHPRSLVGGPLAPPPPRSKLPTRTSISSSSMRSLPLPIPSSNTPGPLSPPPPRARALSGASNDTRNRSGGSRRTSDATVTNANQPPAVNLSRTTSQATTAASINASPYPKRMDSLRHATRTIKNNRQSMKPSFLDIEFEDDDAEHERTFVGLGKGGVMESSFLDMDRGNSMETTRDELFV